MKRFTSYGVLTQAFCCFGTCPALFGILILMFVCLNLIALADPEFWSLSNIFIPVPIINLGELDFNDLNIEFPSFNFMVSFYSLLLGAIRMSRLSSRIY